MRADPRTRPARGAARARRPHRGRRWRGSADDATRRARDAIAASESGGGATVVGARMRVVATVRRVPQRVRVARARPRRRVQPAGHHGARQLLGVARDPGRRRQPAGQRPRRPGQLRARVRGGDAGRARRGPDALRRRLARHGHVRSCRRGGRGRPHDGPGPRAGRARDGRRRHPGGGAADHGGQRPQEHASRQGRDGRRAGGHPRRAPVDRQRQGARRRLRLPRGDEHRPRTGRSARASARRGTSRPTGTSSTRVAR